MAKLREAYRIERRGKRWAIVRETKVGRTLEIRVTIKTTKLRLDALEWLKEAGLA